MDADDRWEGAALALVDGIGPQALRSLRDAFGSWHEAWRAGPKGWASWLLASDRWPRLEDWWRKAMAEDLPGQLRRCCRRLDIALLTERDAAYPGQLRQLERAAPTLLFARGQLEVLAQPCITVVGTRRATPYGLATAARIARELVEAGVAVVSGLAFGIDAAAHAACLEAGGATIAVLAAGVERALPASQDHLYRRMLAAGGLIVSEYPPGTRPSAGRFPARNRILAGLGAATIVVEAPAASGALITARFAADWGRPVFAVTAPPTALASRGCLELIQDGAAPFLDTDEVLRQARLATRRRDSPTQARADDDALRLTPLERVVYSWLDVAQATSIDAIIAGSGLPPAAVTAAVARLEVRGLCVRSGSSVLATVPPGGPPRRGPGCA